jgi:hypothetical protein
MAKASTKKPLCIVIAGTNGAGKTTFARESARADSEKRIADTRGWSIAVKVGGVLCGKSASILIRWTNGGLVKIYGLSLLRGPCLSDNRSALCGVCVRLKPKDR